ncbi:MAG TPA: MFS transporter [Mucilaginibacter sp.]|nr:MFS transporter [Mucilaginibacter sp.]
MRSFATGGAFHCADYMKYITRTVWILSLISLFTDTASEMLYPVMPMFLKSIGFSVVLIGILEGVAETTAGLSKGYFGKLSDTSGKRVPFVRLGYSISAVSKPMLAVFVYPLWIFFARTLDRLGKGIRTGARDAILSGEASPATKGKVFGFHRSMDTMGAVLGPAIALVFLYFHPHHYKTLFLVAFLPGLLAIGASFYVKKENNDPPVQKARVTFFSFLNYWRTSPPIYRRVVAGMLVFAIFNSSDFFLLLKIKQSGLNDTWVIGVYIFYNIVYALFSYPLGSLGDKIGLKTIFLLGLAMFGVVYGVIAFNSNIYIFAGLFFLYGIYAAATDGISKAWITNITDKKDAATAIGTLTGFQSICAMLASSLTGVVWSLFGATAAFLITGVMTAIVILYFLTVPGPSRQQPKV